jgi:hypothetical protein
MLFGDDLSLRKKSKYKYNMVELAEAIKEIPVKGRRSVRKLAAKVGIPKSIHYQHVHPSKEPR